MTRIAFALSFILFAGISRAEVSHYAIVIGNNRGARDELTLRYAESDADKMAAVLRELGDVPPENLVLLRSERAETVARAIIAVNDRIRARGGETTLVVYYSGHADASSLHLGDTRLDLEELVQLVRGSAARFRVFILDSCRSGALTRFKGGSRAPPFSIKLDERLESEGAIMLTASAADEDAQESDELKGSFFSHYLLSALMGAADRDANGQITLEEAYRYAYENTLRASSRTLSGTQHPSFAFSVRGQGDIVLTTLRQGTRWSRLRLPPDRDWLLFVNNPDGAIAAELGARDPSRTLWVQGGRYFVRGRSSDFLLEGVIVVPPASELIVRDEMLARVAYAKLVRKGAAPRSVVQSPFAAYRLRTAIIGGASLCHGATVGWGFETRRVTLEPRLVGCRGEFANSYVRANTDELGFELALVHAWDFSWFTVDVGLVGGVSWLRETFYPLAGGTAPARDSAAGELGAELGLSALIGRGIYTFFRAAASMYVFAEESTDVLHTHSTHVAPAGVFSIGIGKQFY